MKFHPIVASFVLSVSALMVQMPSQIAAQVSHPGDVMAGTSTNQILRDAKTIYVHSKSSILKVDTLDHALLDQKDWNKLGLTIVQNKAAADVVIELDRVPFHRLFTFVMTDSRTTAILGSSKVESFDGTTASGHLAKDIVEVFSKARLPQKP